MRNLVVVRAGEASLHETWLDGAPRTWDLIVSYYGDDPRRFRRDDVTRIDQKGGKFEGLHALFTGRPELLKTYDYVWLPDDDLAAGCATINRIFAAMEEYELHIAQPSLAPSSYASFSELIRNPEFRLRYTTFVENMMPCFEAGYLAEIVHLFAGLRFGWNLDRYWTRMIVEPPYRAAIIDACEVVHTRALGGGTLYTSGSATAEGDRVAAAFAPLRMTRGAIYGGITRDGRLLRRGPAFAWRSLKGIGAVSRHVRGRDSSKAGRLFRLRALRRHTVQRVDLSPVPVPAAIP